MPSLIKLQNALIICLLSNFLFSICAKGQSAADDAKFKTDVTMPSPTQSSLLKFTEVPVSLYTGVPEISIPLFTFKSKELEIPISLAYHASGIKVNEVPSWVGAGWNLTTGGSITRVVRGLADDYQNSYMSSFLPTHGYLANGKYIEYASSTPLSYAEISWNQAMGYFDTEPDLFYYNIPGYSGKFVFEIKEDLTPEIVLLSGEKLKITYDITSSRISSFTIITPNGLRYLFNDVETLLTYTDNYDSQQFANYAEPSGRSFNSTWQLSKVFSSSNVLIANFLYHNVEEQYEESIDQVTYFPLEEYSFPCSIFLKSTRYLRRVNRCTAHTKKLASINVINYGKVDFVLGASQREDLKNSGKFLESIVIKRMSGDTIKNYKLSYSYASDGNGNSYENKRLFLDSLVEMGGGLKLPPYVFTYYKRNQLPSRKSMAVDYWGYYNAAFTNTGLTPPIPELNQPGANRDADTVAVYGTLIGMMYPTKGLVRFKYELNDYSYLGADTLPLIIDQKNYHSGSATLYAVDGVSAPGFAYAAEDQFANVSFGKANNSTYPAQISATIYPVKLKSGITTPTSVNDVDFDPSRPVYSITQSEYKRFQKGWYMGQVSITANFNQPTSTSGYLSFSIYDATYKPSPPIKGGGIRIKEIEYIADTINAQVKRNIYSYSSIANPLRSSGSLVSGRRNYADTIPSVYNFDIQQLVGTEMVTYRQLFHCGLLVVKNYNNIQFELTNGSPIGYQNVRLKSPGNGWQDFYFTSPIDYPDTLRYKAPFSPPTSYEFARGLEKAVVTINESGDTVQTKINTYSFEHLNSVYAKKIEFLVYDPRNFSAPIYDDYLGYIVASKNTLPSNTTVYVDDDINQFHEGHYMHKAVWKRLDKTLTTNYSGSNKLVNTEIFTYNPLNHEIAEVKSLTSKGDTTVLKQHYSIDYTTTDSRITDLISNNVINAPIDSKSLINGKLITHKQFVYNKSNLPLDMYEREDSIGLLAPNIQLSNPYTISNRNILLRYDTNHNLIYVNNLAEGSKSYVYGYHHVYPIAEFLNADSNQVAHTSFETSEWGKWDITDTARDRTVALTGNQSYVLQNGKTISKLNLPTGSKYIVSYWSRNGSASVNGENGSALMVKNGWTYWKHILPGSTTSVNIMGSNITIDELTLYPEDCRVKTFTYDPLVGMTSICNENQSITYFTYDGLGRLVLIKDIDKNIIKRICYNYAGQPENCN